jgi:hypothetical protein
MTNELEGLGALVDHAHQHVYGIDSSRGMLSKLHATRLQRAVSAIEIMKS